MIKQRINSFFFELLGHKSFEKVKSIVYGRVLDYGDPKHIPDDQQLEYYYYSQVWELVYKISALKEESARIARLRGAYEFFSENEYINVNEFSI